MSQMDDMQDRALHYNTSRGKNTNQSYLFVIVLLNELERVSPLDGYL